MRSVSHPDVYAIGDAAMAMGPGGQAPADVLRLGRPHPPGRPPTPSRPASPAGSSRTCPIRYFNQCVSLGRKEGLIQYVTADDRAVSAVLTGRLAALYKELVCKGAAWGVANPTLGIPTRRRHILPEPARKSPTTRTPA